jgi:hypothetical protein
LKLRWAPDSARHVEASVLALDERQRWRTGTFYNFGDNRQASGRVNGSWAIGAHRLSSTVLRVAARPPLAREHRTAPVRRRQWPAPAPARRPGRAAVQRAGGPAGTHALDVGVQLRRDQTETAR